MRKIFLFISLGLLPLGAQATTLLGISFGSASIEGQRSNHGYSGFPSYGLMFGVNGTGNFSFESGLSQLADITDRYIKTEKLEVSIFGIYLSGRYSRQFSPTGFAYLKAGVYTWRASTSELYTDSTSLESNKDIAKNSVNGYSPTMAVGADFLLSNEFALRVEFEHINGIGGGVKLESENRRYDQTEKYNYNRINLGAILAF